MRVDVSEIKSFRTCKRQWQLSSRNQFHLAPRYIKPAFTFGTMFHESLHSLYLGVPVEKVIERVEKDITGDEVALIPMIKGYAKEVLPDDLERFRVVDIEHKFDFVPLDPETGDLILEDFHFCGSIDMIAIDEEQQMMYGFEHKTCKKFRDEQYMWMDEQPRMYVIAMQQYVEKYNKQHGTSYVVGGVFMNEVKKLMRKFEYKRTLCNYPEEDLHNFLMSVLTTCTHMVELTRTDKQIYPQPSYMGCQMCDFKDICHLYQYQTLDKDVILAEFEEEFAVREEDHLDEKVERSNENASNSAQ